MKKAFLFIALSCISMSQIVAQNIYTVESSNIKFFSEAPLENIEAVNTATKGLINVENNKVAFVVPIKGFDFEKDLMEEHFNENYMESEKFPKGSFKGAINEDINWKNDGTYDVTVTGVLNIHGVEQTRTIPGKLTLKKNQIVVDSKFQIKLEDHNIEIPTVVFQNIAEEIDVTVNLNFVPKK